jgi:Raf kinase inhibitor-like YbhB/YbcL family protein
MQLTSPAFSSHGEIPSIYTCDGVDRAPQLDWTDVPPGAGSFALIVDDPDIPDPAAPEMTWVHFVTYNMPAATRGLPDGGRLPAGTRGGVNDWRRTTWSGPCPPTGRHRYFFKLYALDTVLPDLEGPTASQLEEAIEGHVLARAELVGTYQRKRPR